MLSSHTYTEIKPFVAAVGANNQATVEIGHSVNGLVWQVFQIGFALGEASFNPQVGAHFNGMPITSTVIMQPVTFPGVPYAMVTYFVGPPYVGLKAGDKLVCTVINAKAGDTFTASAFISEEQYTGPSNQAWWYS